MNTISQRKDEDRISAKLNVKLASRALECMFFLGVCLRGVVRQGRGDWESDIAFHGCDWSMGFKTDTH